MSTPVYAETNSRIFRFTTHPEDTPTGTCDVCDSLDGVEVEERLIGGAFPNAEQSDENSYDSHIHKTCACTLDIVEDNQAPEPETPETQPNMFTYWQNKDTKRDGVNVSETSSTPSKFAYWRNMPEKTEAEKTPPKPKSGNVPAEAKDQPKSTVNHERPEEVKPQEEELDDAAKSSEQEPVKLPEGLKQDLEIAQQALPEKLAINEQALSKLVYWPNKGARSK